MNEKKPPPRFFVPGLTAGTVDLPGDEAHHARNVLRLRVAQAVELFDGVGAKASGPFAFWRNVASLSNAARFAMSRRRRWL